MGDAASHTGSLAGADEVYHAAFGCAGMLRVASIEELLDVAQTLSPGVKHKGDRLAIVINGGGRTAGCRRLVQGNPVDIIGDSDGPRYTAALDIFLPSSRAQLYRKVGRLRYHPR